jgi:hypothetical protein
VDTLNIQQIPTPLFYLGGPGGHGHFRSLSDAANSAASVVSAFAIAGHFRSVADAANSGASIVSAFAMNSSAYPLTDLIPLSVNFPHGMASAPAFLRAVYLCTNDDTFSNAVVGQEIDFKSIFNESYASFPCGFGADATKIYLNKGDDGASACQIKWTGSPGDKLSSFTNFSLKVYWQ